METGARNGVAGRTEKGRKRERKTGRENGREAGVKSGAEQRRNGAKSGHDKTAGVPKNVMRGNAFGRVRARKADISDRRKAETSADRAETVQRCTIGISGAPQRYKSLEIAFSPHKNGAEGETDREGDEIKRRNGKNEGIRRQRAKNGGKTDLRTPAGVCEEKGTRPRIYNYGNQSVQSGRNGC